MHTKNYIAFAEAIKDERAKAEAWMDESLEFEFGHGQLAGIEKIARRAADIFRADNERFNVDQFLTAAGIQ